MCESDQVEMSDSVGWLSGAVFNRAETGVLP